MSQIDQQNFEQLREGNMTVLSAEGDAVPVDRLWADGPAVIGFVRHFG